MADITINIRIRRDIKRRLQLYACDRDIPLRNLADNILLEWLQQQAAVIVSPPRETIASFAPKDFAAFPRESKFTTL